MKNSLSVIICCAGMGTRLGIGTTKTLLNVSGKSIIERQLELLKDVEDIRIVIGYKGNKVIETVNSIRKDIMYVWNYDYKDTGEAESLSRAIIGLNEYTIILDGDLLINRDDFQKILDYTGECIGICNINSDEPTYAKVVNGCLINLNEIYGNFEYAGVAKIKSERLNKCNGSIYSMINMYLPLPIINVRSRDIDTPDDYDRMIEWFNNSCVE